MTNIQVMLNRIEENLINTLYFSFYPLLSWTNSSRHNTLSYALLPFYVLANIITLGLGMLAAVFQAIATPFACIVPGIWDLISKKPTASDDITSEEDDPEIELPGISEQWHDILKYGRWAPSPHNMQPWLFQKDSKDTINLLYDPKRLLPGTNPTGSFMHVAFGMLMETLSIATAAKGFDVEARYIDSVMLNSDAKGPQPLATLKLVPRNQSTPEETLDRQLILDRRTSRLPYDGLPVSEEVLLELSAVAEKYHHKMESSSDKSQVDWVIRLNAKTMFYDMSKAKARNEVSSWMRFSKNEAISRADGLAAYAMNVSGWQMWLFANMNWIFRIPGIYHLVLNSYEKKMSGTASVAWLSGPFENQADWENAGRMMTRWWLTMTKYNVYLHPFGSVITNEEAHAQMVDHFKEETRENDLWMLVRLGYGESPPQAKRMPLKDMVIASHISFFPPASTSPLGVNEKETSEEVHSSNNELRAG